MKKNISINIGGIIFHIEEDGFEALKQYLDTINRYFSDFDDSQEIINDIENRIAEIFLSKLKEDKQVINNEDIKTLMATLGSIEDFKKAEEQTEPEKEETKEEAKTENSNEFEWGQPKKLYRDTQRKILGGVAAGIAHYHNVDSLWIRLSFIALFAVLAAYTHIGFVVILGYVLCWIILPANPFLKEDDTIKKFFRSSENKVIGGVARGLSSYFGIDVALVRIIFVLLTIPFGLGTILYLILWLITPYAKTVTQKMQMEGTPITLSNIEKNIKTGFNVKDGEESTFVKILLFPFRLIATILDGIAKALGPLLNFIVDLIRIFFGIALFLFGLSSSISIIFTALFAEGLRGDYHYLEFLEIPHQIFSNTISIELVIFTMLLALIPSIFLAIAGISVIAKRWVLNRPVGFTLLGIWILSLVLSAVYIPLNIVNFRTEATYKEEQTFTIQDKTAILQVNDIGREDLTISYITLKGHEGNEFRLEKNFEARGSSRENAIENAKMVSHEVVLKNDSVLWIDSDIRFNSDAAFRAQNLRMTLFIPYNQPFEMERKMRYLLRSTIYKNGYNVNQVADNTWVFNEEGLQCLTCEVDSTANSNSGESTRVIKKSENFEGAAQGSFSNDAFFRAPYSGYEDFEPISYNFDSFTSITASTGMFVEIRQGNTYQVLVYADPENLEGFEISQRNSNLKITFNGDGRTWTDIFDGDFFSGKSRRNFPDIKCVVIMPELKRLELSAAATAHLVDFEETTARIELSSAAKLYGRGNFSLLRLDMSSASKAIMAGYVNTLDADLSSTAKLEAYELTANNADIDVSSAASAEVNIVNELKANASSAGKIRYKGSTNTSKNSSSAGSIRKTD